MFTDASNQVYPWRHQKSYHAFDTYLVLPHEGVPNANMNAGVNESMRT